MTGGEPSLREWQQRGFRVGEAREWRADGFAPDDAERWRTAGVYRPRAAREWRATGATAYTVDVLLRAGMTPRDAVRWREFGVPADRAAELHLAGESPGPRPWWARFRRRRPRLPAAQAATLRALLGAGVPADRARGYLDGGWAGDEAVGWARRGVPPGDALVFRALGFTAAEGAAQLAAGHDGAAVMAAWWRAGVPFDEVAAWSAAGFGAAEAQAQRAAGADLEQAKVLRALNQE